MSQKRDESRMIGIKSQEIKNYNLVCLLRNLRATYEIDGMAHGDKLVASTTSHNAPLHTSEVSRYNVEHLASFQHELDKEITPSEAMLKLEVLEAEGGLWPQRMSMEVTDDVIEMYNGQTLEIIEEYLLENINFFAHVVNRSLLKYYFVFSTKFSSDKVGAIHIFRGVGKEPAVINADVNRRRIMKAQTMKGANVNSAFSNDVEEKKVVKSTELSKSPSLKESHVVHQRIESFQKNSEERLPMKPSRTGSSTSADYPNDIRDARVARDVKILNRCIDEIEEFVDRLKFTNEARKKLSRKGRKSTKAKYENLRQSAKGPNEAAYTDIFQKFKYAFNLLAKLKPHIKNPNAPELVHYLFAPLGIIVKLIGLEFAQSIMVPWLSISTLEMMSSCLYTTEGDFLKSLGPNWNLPQSAPNFRDKPHAIYVPVFKDGWSPPEVIDDRSKAAAQSAASMVARMKASNRIHMRRDAELFFTKKLLVASFNPKHAEEEAELKKKGLLVAQRKISVDAEYENDLPIRRQEPVNGEKPAVNGSAKYARVAYDYWAHNTKELTIRAGERVLVVDDSRRWWLVRNDHDEQGYVPSTVLEYPSTDDNSDTSSGDGSTSVPTSPQNVTAPVVVASTQVKRVPTVPKRKDPAPPSKDEPGSPTVVTAKSIITESAQFSQASPAKEPPPLVSPKPVVVQEPVTLGMRVTEEEEQPPDFLPPPPPYISADAPSTTPRAAAVDTSDVIVSPISLKYEEVVHHEQHLHSELNSKLSVKSNSSLQAEPVDFFIPLFKSSTADDVSRWLKKLAFEPITIEKMEGVAAKELFKMSKEDLIERVGEEEGTRLAQELEVQIGANTRHKTMTEFQKVLLEKKERQETIQKNVQKHQVVVKSAFAPNQVDLQKKFLEQQRQLKHHDADTSRDHNVGKLNIGTHSREPEKPSFSSFAATSTINNDGFYFTPNDD
eukprot:gene17087-18808_t